MADHTVYLYAVADALLAESDEVRAMRGIDGAPVRVVVDGRLAAVVSSVDASRFSEEGLRRNLEDLRWLEEIARGHNTVVAELAQTHSVAPVRMATIFTDNGNVRALLGEHAAEFTAALARIRGRTEWGVKAFARPAAEKVSSHGTQDDARPGTSYLMRRRTERDHAAWVREDSLQAAEAVHDVIAQLAVASRRYPPQDPRLSGHQDEMVLNAAYLVDAGGEARLRHAVEEVGARGLSLLLTGPWAPYSFATLDVP